jgi:hypothetical protein
VAALDTEAVATEVVVTAGWTHQTTRRVGLQPALAFAAVPDAILGAEHPTPPLAIKDRQVSYRQPERSGLQTAGAALLDEGAIAELGISERIDCHVESIA